MRVKLTIEGDGKGFVSHVHLPLVITRDPPPPPLVAHSFGLFYFFPRFPGVCAVGGFRVSHHFPVVLGESTCRKWSESTKCKQGQSWDGLVMERASFSPGRRAPAPEEP